MRGARDSRHASGSDGTNAQQPATAGLSPADARLPRRLVRRRCTVSKPNAEVLLVGLGAGESKTTGARAVAAALGAPCGLALARAALARLTSSGDSPWRKKHLSPYLQDPDDTQALHAAGLPPSELVRVISVGASDVLALDDVSLAARSARRRSRSSTSFATSAGGSATCWNLHFSPRGLLPWIA